MLRFPFFCFVSCILYGEDAILAFSGEGTILAFSGEESFSRLQSRRLRMKKIIIPTVIPMSAILNTGIGRREMKSTT